MNTMDDDPDGDSRTIDTNELNDEIERLNLICSEAEDKVERKVSEITQQENDFYRANQELSEYRRRAQNIQQKCQQLDVEIEKVKWNQEMACLVWENNKRKNQLDRSVMASARETYVNMTTYVVQPDQQETVDEAVDKRMNELMKKIYRMKKKFQELRKKREEIDRELAEVNKEIMGLRNRNNAIVLRLRRKLEDSQVRKRTVLAKLKNYKTRKSNK